MAISIGLLSYNYLNEKKEKVFNDVNLEYYALANPVEAKDDKIDNLESDEEEVKEEEEPIVNNYSNYFIGILDIPKINLSRGFVNPSSSENNVDKNIEIVKTSDMPDVDKGNFILAAHSGNSYVSYFKNLYLLNNGDYVYVTYNGVKYTYQIKNIYLQVKTGQIGIYRDINKTTLTLVTCTKNDEAHQTIYIAELINRN